MTAPRHDPFGFAGEGSQNPSLTASGGGYSAVSPPDGSRGEADVKPSCSTEEKSYRVPVGVTETGVEGLAVMQKGTTVRERMEARIARNRGDDVFLTREFRDLGDKDRVAGALRQLVRDKRLVRLGYGVYGRAMVSRLSGNPVLYARNGFAGAAREALTKLGVEWQPVEAERAYNERRSTQVPVNPVVRVKGRFSRRLFNGSQELIIER